MSNNETPENKSSASNSKKSRSTIHRNNMTPSQREHEKNKRRTEKTPSQLTASREYQRQYRFNMSQQLDAIDKQRINSYNNNSVRDINRLNKKEYIKQFNSKLNGELTEQDWVGPLITL